MLAVAFTLAAHFSHIPWFIIPGGASVLGYVAFAFATKPVLSGMSHADFVRYIASRAVVLLIVVGVLISTAIQTF